MLQTNRQNDYSEFDFEFFKNNYNNNLINLANIQLNLLNTMPSNVDFISKLADKLSNLIVISGNCFYYKTASQLKEVSNNNIIFDKNTNAFKLKSLVSYKIEVKQKLNNIISNKPFRVFNANKTQLAEFDDLLIKKLPICISTEENNYKYTLAIKYNEIYAFNNISLKLNNKTISYPNISEIFYIDKNKEKRNIKILNNNRYGFNTDINKNISNVYLLDLEATDADNINIIFEDIGADLILDSLEVNFIEYVDEGEIILEALNETDPILKIGAEADTDINYVNFEISYNNESWIPLDISNSYNADKINKIISFNTFNENSIKTSEDIKKLYFKIKMRAIKETYNPSAKVNREIFYTQNFDTSLYDYTSLSLYENISSNNYGNTSKTNIFNYQDMYNNGEYIIINNVYQIKGFLETAVSKIPESIHNYLSVDLKTKEKRITGEIIPFNDVDISTKQIYSFKINKLKKDLTNQDNSKYVIPLKEDSKQSIYYLKQKDKEIKIDLTLGFINSAIDVLYTVEENSNIYLLDSFKNLICEITPFEKDEIFYVSLLDSGLFEEIENLSKIYPLYPLNDYEVGLIDNKIVKNNLDTEITVYDLEYKKLYTKDFISSTNDNYSVITSIEDYKNSIKTKIERIESNIKVAKLLKSNLVKGSVLVDNKNLIEIPYNNGHKEFLELLTKQIKIHIADYVFNYTVELSEDSIVNESLSFINQSQNIKKINIELRQENNKYFLDISSPESLVDTDLLISYTFNNTNPKKLYSIDYANSIIYFSEDLDEAINVSYNFDNILTTGKQAYQLSGEEYNIVNKTINIKNFKENSYISFLYKNENMHHRNITPIVNNLKINYITNNENSI